MNFITILKKYRVILDAKQKFLGIIVLLFSVFGALFEMLGVSIIVPFTNVLIKPMDVFHSKTYSIIVNTFKMKSPDDLTVFLAISIAVIYMLKNIYFFFLSWLRAKYAAKIDRELSVGMMRSYMNKGYSYFTNTNTGILIRGIQTDVTNVEMLLYNLIKFVTDFTTILFIAIYMILIDWQLALGIGIMSILCFIIVGKIFANMNLKAGVISRNYLAKSNQSLLQALQGIKEVLVLKKESFFTQMYEKNYTRHLQSNLIRVICGESPAYIIEGTCVTTIFLIICIRVYTVGMSDSVLPVLASFIVAAFRVLPSIGKLTSEYSAMNYYYAGLDAVYDNIQKECTKQSMQVTLCNSDIVEEKLKFEKKLTIENISFSYSHTNPVISHLTLEIVKGESIAFIGPSGSGKTTLSDIILGLLVPQHGRILLDGKDIRKSPYSWSKMVGYVSQTIYLADDTVRFNVAFGVDEKDIDDERVWNCLKKAKIDDYVKNMENGIYTLVGDRGVKISGGQRQRIAIARALYHNPQILVLDEATSALDNETEKAVMESIETLQGEITLVIVAHRLSTVSKCDRIYEINNGIAVEKEKLGMGFTANENRR